MRANLAGVVALAGDARRALIWTAGELLVAALEHATQPRRRTDPR